ncbi:MAG: hypothetical protein KDD29_06575 [Flavobacteriales bacterium]|nr:hypothetical protein [Flavobacteriales bacterium]MCB0409866.1 hypothetical protein [Flavobacteriales bacterium]MCB9336194.1 hypothetical protein [Flavobacteriales bacterium]
MKYLFIILIGVFTLCFSNTASAQFWKKKGSGSVSAKSSTYEAPKHRDAFSGKNKKGPNITSTKKPRTKSKAKLYSHSISKKPVKLKNQSVFSSKKRRYKSAVAKPKSKDKNSAGSSGGGRKSGKGRKKN